MTEEYPEHFLEEPGDAVYEAMRARRSRAEADPLEIGSQLPWSGPSLEDNVSPQRDPSTRQANLTNSSRRFHEELLDFRSGPPSRPWTLTLIEPLQSGCQKWSQVWRAKATPKGQEEEQDSRSVPVVVKIFQESFFPYPNGDSAPSVDRWNWYSPSFLRQREAQAYRLARNLQGSSIPFCYGFYSFNLPSQEAAIGVVLEDLVTAGRALDLDAHFAREAKGKRLSLDTISELANAAFRIQHDLHETGLSRLARSLSDMSILRSTSTIVAHGFSRSWTRDALIENHAETIKNRTEAERTPFDDCWDWRIRNQMLLFGSLHTSLRHEEQPYRDMARDWQKRELETNSLDFIVVPWHLHGRTF